MSQVNECLALELARKNANEMELEHVRELIANDIYEKLLKLSREDLLRQADEAGIIVDQQLIIDNAIEMLEYLATSISRQWGEKGRCSDVTYSNWRNQVNRVIALLS